MRKRIFQCLKAGAVAPARPPTLGSRIRHGKHPQRGAQDVVRAAPEIATGSSAGMVTALAAGTATITAHSDAGVGFPRVVV
jgi:hypothetical protein